MKRGIRRFAKDRHGADVHHFFYSVFQRDFYDRDDFDHPLNWVATEGDHDVFGDGRLTIIPTPGHTPGHHSLLVRLREMGPVLLTGDLAHFHENYDTSGVPSFNTDRADTLASIDRFKKIAANLKATVVIQHDARDVSKLPAFPAAAK